MSAHYFIVLAAAAQQGPSQARSIDIASFVAEAAKQTGLPEAVVWAVLSTESRGNLTAVSPKGAMGAMQLMPKTWSMLRTKLGLGPDPFDPRDNILAGAHYLRDLYDRYGWSGTFAAYNAGPGRYEAYRDQGRSLPTETRDYVMKIAEALGSGPALSLKITVAAQRIPWTQSELFVGEPASQSSLTNDPPPLPTPFVATSSPTPLTPQ